MNITIKIYLTRTLNILGIIKLLFSLVSCSKPIPIECYADKNHPKCIESNQNSSLEPQTNNSITNSNNSRSSLSK